MAALFFSLLALDWLSIKYPGQDQSQIDPEKAVEQRKGSERKRFLDPIMKLVAPPCDFCLRNMSVMFTPSFILIPAREVIPGKEIGLLAAWFTISQVAAFVFPVLLYRALTWLEKQPKRLRERYQARRKREQDLRRIQSRRSSNATLAGSELAKQLSASGGNHRRLSVVAMGINDLTAIVTAPVAHLTMGKGKTRYEDERLQIEHVQIETARQQGDPAVATPAEIATMTGSPQGHWDGFFQHRQNHQHRHQHHHHRPHQPPGLQRGRSLSKAVETGRPHSSSRGRNMRPTTPKRSQSVPAAPLEAVRPATPDAGTPKAEVHFHPSTIPAKSTEGQAQGAPRASLAEQLAAYSLDDMPQRRNLSVVFDDDAITDAGTRRPSRADSQATVENATNKLSFDGKGARINAAAAAAAADDDDGIDAEKKKVHYSKDQAARDSTESAKKPRVTVSDGDVDGDGDGHDDATRRSSDASQLSSECEDSAVERLSDWIADLITPAIYTILFVVGIPLFLVHDFALPLFLGINLLSFLAAITVIPPKWRRYLHPILTTSIATVFIIWCFGKAKGLSIRGVMDYYSNGAKYSVLWDLGGYSGPVPGAGDLLFSTLDAGIVALAVPMYRYRVDLAENFTRMMTILVPCASLSLFFWPWIGHLFGLDEVRSLAFTARFMSTPLAIEMANTVGADESITVIIVVITGILAAILKEPFFRMMRVDMDDHICVGVTMGSTAGAIGASSLISRPRVMAVASLAFVLFGTLLLICAAVPNIVDVVRQLCGAAPA
ncbi:uncharacterized protein PFL1_01616 [Pseudozyma flocculosa PF-1]|nr:uncharacterized protein PFL1_01616 [Pseudozyma flocculosa PF-1]EPQ30715.1 hypothetical protein PFL1_01616 [Pseudozyma flocculosa PF-1]